MSKMIDEGTQVRRASSHLDAEVQGETIILHGSTGVYFGLNETGTELWKLLVEPRTVGEVVDAIDAKFDATRDQILPDVLAVVTELIEAGLLVRADEPVRT